MIDHEDRAKDVHIPDGPITRSKARALQEAVRSLMMTVFPVQEATKIMHVTACAMVPGSDSARTSESARTIDSARSIDEARSNERRY